MSGEHVVLLVASRTLSKRFRIAMAAALMVTACALIAPFSASAEPRVVEGQTLQFEVTIAELPWSGCKVEYDYFTKSGTAREGDDFKAIRGKLAFWRGDKSRTKKIEVETLTDDCGEEDETVILMVTNGASIALNDGSVHCQTVTVWREKRFVGTIEDDGTVSSSAYETDKYGCPGTGTVFGE